MHWGSWCLPWPRTWTLSGGHRLGVCWFSPREGFQGRWSCKLFSQRQPAMDLVDLHSHVVSAPPKYLGQGLDRWLPPMASSRRSSTRSTQIYSLLWWAAGCGIWGGRHCARRLRPRIDRFWAENVSGQRSAVECGCTSFACRLGCQDTASFQFLNPFAR